MPIRSLLKAREFTLVAVAIVAIGIGANTAVFSIVDAALLRPLPFKDPSRLFILSASNPKRAITDGPFSYPVVRRAQRRATRCSSGVAAVANERFNASDGDRPEQLPGARVSASFFDVLGVTARARPDVHAGRGQDRRAGGRGDRPPLLDAALRRRAPPPSARR